MAAICLSENVLFTKALSNLFDFPIKTAEADKEVFKMNAAQTHSASVYSYIYVFAFHRQQKW